MKRQRDMTAELHEASGSNKDEEKFTSVDNTSGGQDGKQEEEGGFAMELGRMMPARFSHFKWNIPLLVAFNTPIWLGSILSHETYYLDGGSHGIFIPFSSLLCAPSLESLWR